MRGGFLAMEAIVSVFLVTMLLLAFTVTLDRFAKAHQWMRIQHQAVLAAEGELDRLRAGAPPSSAEEMAGRYPKLQLRIERTAAVSPWEGFDLVTVTMRREIRGKSKVASRIVGYVPTTQPAGPETTP